MKTIETDIDYNEFRVFVLFTLYYQEMMCLLDDKKDKSTIKKINDVMDYHFMKVYSEEYNNCSNIIDTSYKCICTLD